MWHNMGVTIEAPESLRERKKARTQEALQSAALELFQRQGFEHTTVEDIAAACEVSPRTFFRYFPTKSDVLLGSDVEERRDRMLGLLAAQPANCPAWAALRAAVLSLTQEYEHERERIAARMAIIEATPSLRATKSEYQRGWDDAVVEVLADRARRAGAPADPLTLRLLAGAGTVALRAAVDMWLAGPKSGSLTQLLREAFDELAAGLEPPTGRRPVTTPR
jgi:AcrR family transcriptional regulator